MDKPFTHAASEMTRTTLMILGFALFLSFIVLALQFNSIKLPALILSSVPFCLAGMAGMLFATGKPLGAPVVIGALVVVAAMVNAGVLLFSYARTLQQEGPSHAALPLGEVEAGE